MIELLSESDSTVLIQGESGTGKELLANSIHAGSHRSKGPMVTINCSAIPDALLESELFGYKAGAFTDAKKDKPGRLELAEGGTLFLDEIGDISPMLQVRLLRVLQEKTYEPLGSVRSEKANVRILAATNKNLEKMVEKGVFRQDLYYRINVIKLNLPPLRKRKEDIPLLIEHFISKFNRLNAKEIYGISQNALSILMAHQYPGNIRELENIIEYASVVCKNSLIRQEHFPEHLFLSCDTKNDISREYDFSAPVDNAAEKKLIYETLNKYLWHRGRTAEHLGIHPTTLWRKIKQFNIDLPKTDGRSCSRQK
jgi:transcriptional regulator with PAS, ATPase and Fis domain